MAVSRRSRGTAVLRSPGVWQLQAPLPADENGRYGRRSKTVQIDAVRPRSGGLPKPVAAALAAFVAEVDSGKVVEPARTGRTYKELFEEWLSNADLEERTKYGYRQYFRCYLEKPFGKLSPDKITVKMIDSLYASMREQGLSTRTIRQTHAILRRSLTVGWQWEWLPTNPAARTSPSSTKVTPTYEVVAPTLEEVQAVMRQAEQDDVTLAFFIRASVALGTRRGETAALRWTNVDFTNSTITVARSISVVPGSRDREKSTKTGENGTVSVDGTTMAALARHRVECERVAAAGDLELSPSAFIFSDDPSGLCPWAPDTVTHRFARVRDKAELGSHVTLKSLRHFHATHMLSNGVDINTVANRLRHRDKAVTMRFYATKDAKADRASVKVMEGIL